jgi:hypothetical protein
MYINDQMYNITYVYVMLKQILEMTKYSEDVNIVVINLSAIHQCAENRI